MPLPNAKPKPDDDVESVESFNSNASDEDPSSPLTPDARRRLSRDAETPAMSPPSFDRGRTPDGQREDDPLTAPSPRESLSARDSVGEPPRYAPTRRTVPPDDDTRAAQPARVSFDRRSFEQQDWQRPQRRVPAPIQVRSPARLARLLASPVRSSFGYDEPPTPTTPVSPARTPVPAARAETARSWRC